jgi:hypothetical protein
VWQGAQFLPLPNRATPDPATVASIEPTPATISKMMAIVAAGLRPQSIVPSVRFFIINSSLLPLDPTLHTNRGPVVTDEVLQGVVW